MKKRIKGILLILCALTVMFCASISVHAAVTVKTTARLNMRKTASSTGTVVTVVPKGKSITVTTRSADGKWFKGTYTTSKGKKYTGYVYGEYTDTRIVAVKIRMRKSAKVTSSNAKATLKANAAVKILKKKGTGWLYVQNASGTKGYVQVGFFSSDLTDGKIYKTVKVNLNFRSSKKVSTSNIIGTIPAGQKVQVLYETGNWFKVIYNDKTGYVKSGYFKGNEADTSSTVTETLKVAVNLRSKPDSTTTSTRIKTLKAGTTVQVISEYNSRWLYVKAGSTYGYIVSGNFTSDTASTTSSGTVRVTTAAIRIRSSRSTSSDSNVIGVTSKNDEVTVLATYSGWYKVRYTDSKGTVTGYVKSGYFK